jgi:hypothetical protein
MSPGCVSVTLPETTAEERERRMAAIKAATERFVIAVERERKAGKK